jgi:hypothetical protein
MKRFVVLAIVGMAACVQADQFNLSLHTSTPASEPYQVDVSVRGGPVSGYLQTPAGGAPGTSDHERPTFDELDIDDVVYAGIAAFLPLSERTRIYVGGEWIDMSSSGTLDEPLISRVPFPAGASFDATVAFDWYRLGLEHRIDLAGPRFRIAPKVELAVLEFDYELRTPDQSADRAYAKPAARVGVELTWRASDAVGLSLEGSASLPYPDTMPMIATTGGRIEARLVDTDDLAVLLFAGAGLLYIDYEDSQDLPNHIHLEIAPTYEGGIRLLW